MNPIRRKDMKQLVAVDARTAEAFEACREQGSKQTAPATYLLLVDVKGVLRKFAVKVAASAALAVDQKNLAGDQNRHFFYTLLPPAMQGIILGVEKIDEVIFYGPVFGVPSPAYKPWERQEF